MGIFEFFNKKNKKKDDVNLTENNVKTDKKLGDWFQPRIDGGVLELVYNHNIKDGVFVVPQEAISIESCAFEGCDNLETLVLHKGITFIAPNAFNNCKNLKKIVGLSELTEMNNFGGFSGCTGLERVCLPETIEVINVSAFWGCTNLNCVYVPPTCLMIEPYAFNNCASLHYLEIPSTIKFIKEEAFKGCHNLTLMFSDELVDDKQDSNLVKNSFDITIAQGALNDVKTVCAHDIKIIEKVIESGYRGVVSYFDEKNNQVITVDLATIEKICKDGQDFGKEKE